MIETVFEGYVCQNCISHLDNEKVIKKVYATERASITDAPEECIYCGMHTIYLFVTLENY